MMTITQKSLVAFTNVLIILKNQYQSQREAPHAVAL